MKILISSHAFPPSIGGIETVGRLLASEFMRLGNEVMVVTQTPTQEGDNYGYRVIRRPSIAELCRAIKWCDVFWQNNLSLRTLWPIVFLPRPVLITHHGSYCRRPSGIDLIQRIKHAVVVSTPSAAVSRAVASCFRTHSVVIPSPYDAQLFQPAAGETECPMGLIFVGRLVSEKGLDDLLSALHRLKDHGLTPRLTIVGVGPEQSRLEQLVKQLELGDQVIFAGAKQREELVDLLHRHKILVVPSRYDEPFGIVALEGIACGCVVLGSSGGGLPEAIGPCGLTFPNGNIEALAETLGQLLQYPEKGQALRANAAEHLRRFEPATIAQSYLALFRNLV